MLRLQGDTNWKIASIYFHLAPAILTETDVVTLEFNHTCPCCGETFYFPKTKMLVYSKPGWNVITGQNKEYYCPECGCQLLKKRNNSYLYYAWIILATLILLFTLVIGWPIDIVAYKWPVIFLFVGITLVNIGLEYYIKSESVTS